MAIAEAAVISLVTVALTQNQFDALVSWTYNLGKRNLQSSTLLRVLNAGEYAKVPAEIKRWVYANKRVIPGLVNRRAEEATLFASLAVIPNSRPSLV